MPVSEVFAVRLYSRLYLEVRAGQAKAGAANVTKGHEISTYVAGGQRDRLLGRLHWDLVQGDVRKLHPWLQPGDDRRVHAIAIVHDHVCHAIAA